MTLIAPGDKVLLTNRQSGVTLNATLLQRTFPPQSIDKPAVGFIFAIEGGGTLCVEGPAIAELPWTFEKQLPPLPTKRSAVVAHPSYPGFVTYVLHRPFPDEEGTWFRLNGSNAEVVSEDAVRLALGSNLRVVFEGVTDK